MTINQLVGWCVTESVYQSADQSFCQFVSQSASDSVSLSACRSAGQSIITTELPLIAFTVGL